MVSDDLERIGNIIARMKTLTNMPEGAAFLQINGSPKVPSELLLEQETRGYAQTVDNNLHP